MELYEVQDKVVLAYKREWPRVEVRKNFYHTHHDKYDAFDECLDAGRSYLYGDSVTMEEFRRKRQPLTDWQKAAFAYCFQNPADCLVIHTKRLIYTVCRRGEYVEIGLPYHDHGGEKHWITKDGKYKHLVNVD